MATMTTKTITISAKAYEDHDDCLAAAASDTAAKLGLELWQVEARWDDDRERNAILVTVPAEAS